MRTNLCRVFLLLISLNDVISVGMNNYLTGLINLLQITNTSCGSINWCCVQNAVTEDYTLKGCCIPCSCKPLCHYERNCCPDKNISEHLNGTLFENVDAFISFLSETSFNISNTEDDTQEYDNYGNECVYANLVGINSYRPRPTAYKMITKCGNGDANPDIKSKCEEKPYDLKRSTIEDVVPVQTRENGIVYRNKHCLQCSNGTGINYDTWDVYVSCLASSPFVFQNHVESIQEILLQQFEMVDVGISFCDLYFKPKSSYLTLSKQLKVCHNIDVKSCQSGNTHDDTMSKTCINHINPVYTVINNTVTVFKNFACVNCNGHSLQNRDTCGSFHNWHKTVFSGKLNLNLDRISYATAASLEYDTVLDIDVSHKCPKGDLYDEMLAICRRILCPCGMFVKRGKCQPIFTEFIEMNYYIHVKVVPHQAFQNLNVKSEYEERLFSIMNDTFRNSEFTLSFYSLFRTGGKSELKPEYIVILVFNGREANVQYLQVLSVVNALLLKKTEIISEYNIDIDIHLTGKINDMGNHAYDIASKKVYKLLYKTSDTYWVMIKPSLHIDECNLNYRIELLQDDRGPFQGPFVKIKRNNKIIDTSKIKMFSNRSRKVVNVQDIFDMKIIDMQKLFKTNENDHNKGEISIWSKEADQTYIINLDKNMVILYIILAIVVIVTVLSIVSHCRKTPSTLQTDQVHHTTLSAP